jgi:uncharacterized membrane protein YeaQ/YmgE (transglycosylase-associated protein family)
MDSTTIVSIVTFFVTLICGFISKKVPWFKNNLIPLQNLLIGFIVAIVEFIITKDFDTSIMISGLVAGGTYDIAHNIKKLVS